MSRRTYGAGLIATAATFVFMLVAAEGSGAAAQQEADSGLLAAEIATEPSAATEPGTPRFVAYEVVQPLPEKAVEAAADELAAEGAPIASSLHELVTSVPTHENMPQEVLCLAQAVYFEARGEPLAGQLAVARVIINRTESRLFPDSYCSVVKQPGQFSFVKNGRIPSAPEASFSWRRAQAIARIADEELWESKARDALYFHATHVKPRWAATKLARATIDSHIFYR